MAKQVEIPPGIMVTASKKEVSVTEIPALVDLLTRKELEAHSHRHTFQPLRLLVCSRASDGTYVTLSDLRLIKPEFRKSTAAKIACFIIEDADELPPEQIQAIRQNLAFVEPNRHSLTTKEAFPNIINSKELFSHICSQFGSQDKISIPELRQFLIPLSQSTAKRYRKTLGMVDPERSTRAKTSNCNIATEAAKDGRKRDQEECKERKKVRKKEPKKHIDITQQDLFGADDQ